MTKKNKMTVKELISNKDASAPIGRSAGLVSINGEGVLITGTSGVGKSKAAWELIDKGYSIIADDVVELRRVGNSIYGSACKESRNFMEARGVGIVNVKRLIGAGSVKEVERIDLVVNLRQHDEKVYDINLDPIGEMLHFIEIKGVLVPYLNIKVSRGESVANIIKIAAMNNRQKFLGFVAASELLKSMGIKKSKEKPIVVNEKELFG
jgi:HPr kinase/phosphorylase